MNDANNQENEHLAAAAAFLKKVDDALPAREANAAAALAHIAFAAELRVRRGEPPVIEATTVQPIDPFVARLLSGDMDCKATAEE